MLEALAEAETAFKKGEVPIGAVIVSSGKILGRGHNQTENLKDPTAHAEILAIRDACATIGDWRLDGCEIYVTLEPCPMCAYAVVRSRISKIVFGAYDSEYGACGSRINIPLLSLSRPKLQIVGGVLEDRCASILRGFFSDKRKLI